MTLIEQLKPCHTITDRLRAAEALVDYERENVVLGVAVLRCVVDWLFGLISWCRLMLIDKNFSLLLK